MPAEFAEPVTGARRPTLLLIMPRSFYSFARMIVDALEAKGFAVDLHNEEYPETIIGKLLAKLDTGLSRWLTLRRYRDHILPGRRWDRCLIIKGRGVGPELISLLRGHVGSITGYHFDSLNYDRSVKRWSAVVDDVKTFDYEDAAAQDWPVVELFCPFPPLAAAKEKTFEYSAIMRNHSDRLQFLDRIASAIGVEGSFIYIFEKSWLSYAAKALLSPRLYWRWRKYIHLTSLPYDRYIHVMAASNMVIDTAHPDQSGITLRCFEAAAVGARIFTTNSYIDGATAFSRDQFLVIKPKDKPSDIADLYAALRVREAVIMHRPVGDFITELLDRPSDAM
jgi:hypothetical protein